ncbi:K+-dependent Na+/Ca+ exchanger protein [Plesiocystis pacifica SIR-1]|uniref:K+-dependent Na+/Ca+ exchanger protein n=1 Tax=Plesiocystis pacifica SIR-1 TaxID=391625 RepID=A6G117_9BACT|nr:calcium/sodium antiporter [Plesiocystis pacifica]EDM80555.1 K+-dependent Na+/Ca+ exchanger protein [Plesiocystis pacifica SIR-1]
MLIPITMTLLGLALLVAGGEALVRGATSLAQLLRVSPAVIGLTIVAAGTSMPELVVSTKAALAGEPDIALANVIGSNIFNIAAIVGVAALVAPLRVLGNSVRLEWPVMFLAVCQLHLLARDGSVDRLEGGFLLGAQVAFIAYLVWIARTASAPAEEEQFAEALPAPLGGELRGAKAWLFSGLGLVLGMALLVLGGSVLVNGASALALGLGASQRVVGLTIVAAGTSLPELVTSVIASVRGRDDIALTNVLGSNIFNVFGILGTTTLIAPVAVDPELVSVDSWWMIGFAALLFPLMRSGYRVSRLEGGVLVALFVAYLTLLVRSAG